jgi:hypothetical protein
MRGGGGGGGSTDAQVTANRRYRRDGVLVAIQSVMQQFGGGFRKRDVRVRGSRQRYKEKADISSLS